MLTKSHAPRLAEIQRFFMCAVSGDDDRDDVGIALDGGVDDSGAVDSRQAEVRDDDVEREFCEPADRFLAGIRLCHLIAAVGELLGYGLPQGGLVLDEQQMFHGVSHLETANILTQPGLGRRPKSCWRPMQ